jgi:hypothetical protein
MTLLRDLGQEQSSHGDQVVPLSDRVSPERLAEPGLRQ